MLSAEAGCDEESDVEDELGCFEEASASAGCGELSVLVGGELEGVGLVVHAGSPFGTAGVGRGVCGLADGVMRRASTGIRPRHRA